MSGDRYHITDQQGLHFLTFTVVDWMDVFTRPIYKDIIVDSFADFKIKILSISTFIITIMAMHLLRKNQKLSRYLLLSLLLTIISQCSTRYDVNNVSTDDWSEYSLEREQGSDIYLKMPDNYKSYSELDNLFSAKIPSLGEFDKPHIIVNSTSGTQTISKRVLQEIIVYSFADFKIKNLQMVDNKFIGECSGIDWEVNLKGYYACIQNPNSFTLYHLIILVDNQEFTHCKDTMLAISRSLNIE